jgi:predicted acyl esterase
LTPGEVTRFEIAIMATSYVFKPGHRIRLEIVNGDSSVTDAVFAHPYHPSKRGTDTIRHDARYPSRLLLPVVPRRRPPAKAGGVKKDAAKRGAKTAKRRA